MPYQSLISKYPLNVVNVAAGNTIPGSYWGECEAGLINSMLYVRNDTPLHSVLHEACHFICMDTDRRSSLDTDAGGTDVEENAVCYLQILLADLCDNSNKYSMMKAMDDWGYSFRLGSAQAWFEQDADDAKAFLQQHKIIGANEIVCIGQLRG